MVQKMKTTIVYCLLLLLISPLSSATNPNDLRRPLTTKFVARQAEKLIRELNLFPKESINVVQDGHPSYVGPKLVEKRFRFPNIADSGIPVEELGHHAGYYQIEHSYDARYV